MKIYINGLGQMTKMAVISSRPMILKLGMKHQGGNIYKFDINHDAGTTLAYFMARSREVAHAFEWGNLSKCHLKGKS